MAGRVGEDRDAASQQQMDIGDISYCYEGITGEGRRRLHELMPRMKSDAEEISLQIMKIQGNIPNYYV